MPPFEERKKQNNDTGYDLREDYYTLIVPAFLRSYNINLLENDINYEQFCILLGGIADEAFCQIIATRTESDPKAIANFTPGQMEIYTKWQEKLMDDYNKTLKKESKTK